MLKTALHLCIQHQTSHTMLWSWNTHGLVSVGAERMKPKMTLLSPTKANRHMPWFFFLPFRKLFNQSRPFRVQKLWFSERLKKRGRGQEREGERKRGREGRRRKGETEVEGKRKEKGEKGRERTMLSHFRNLIVSGPQGKQTQTESNLFHRPWRLNILAAAYKIGAGCPLIILPWSPPSQKRMNHRTKLNTSLWF